MAKRKGAPSSAKTVEAFTHDGASRRNIPTAEFESIVAKSEQTPVRVSYERAAGELEEEKQRRNRDLDPQLVWRGKDQQDWSDLVVHAPPLYIQEKVHPKALIDDLQRSKVRKPEAQIDLFADFNGVPEGDAKTEFYQHDAHWSNRMILGDSLQVMASLAEREGLRGKVQCIYIDPPYGIKFNSNFQWSTTSRDVKDGDVHHITREPEQVKAFRDTWRDGIHSYLTYLRDRLTVARDLLADSGSIFLQIGSDNVHKARSVLDEVFGENCFVNLVTFQKTSSSTSDFLGSVADYLIWYCKDKASLKFRPMFYGKELGEGSFEAYNKAIFPDGTIKPLASLSDEEKLQSAICRIDNITSQSIGREKGEGASSWFPVEIKGQTILPSNKVRWKTNQEGMRRLQRAGRLYASRNSLGYIRQLADFAAAELHHVWTDTVISGSALNKSYVVETLPRVIQRCILMTTDPGDLVLDPTCGSGTTAYVAEQWGRRWITIDTSRVALALARARIMGARYLYYQLADTQNKSLRQGFKYERIPHITLKSIANDSEIDVIWEKYELTLEPLRKQLNDLLNQQWEEWQIPRDWTDVWTEEAHATHAAWWQARIARQND